jgi:hypothetical protein
VNDKTKQGTPAKPAETSPFLAGVSLWYAVETRAET